MSIEISTLDNGIRVVSHEMEHLETASLGIWINSGARSENPSEHGLSHLLEHMAFKGTERRSALKIAKEIESVGGDLNAATGFESTTYYARVLKEDIGLAVDILGDILQYPKFDRDELKREQNVIIQEIGASRDAPDDLVFDLLQETAFPDQPLGRTILGTPDKVMGFADQDLIQYLRQHYRTKDIILAGAGAVSHQQLIDLANKHLVSFATGSNPEEETAHYVGGEKHEDRPLEQSHIVLAVESVSYLDPDYYASMVLSSILGGGMSSRLFQKIREERGLCYSIYAFNWTFKDTGLFGVYSACSPSDIGELVPLILDELIASCDSLDEEEVCRFRAQFKAGLLMSLESSSTRLEQIARQAMIFDRVIPIDELISKVEEVDVDHVQKVARRLFTNAKPTISTVGPMENLPKYEELIKRFAG